MKRMLATCLLAAAVPSLVSCKSNGSATSVKVLDGTATKASDQTAKSTVGVHIFNTDGKRYVCSGALIDSTHVISAAHCFDSALVQTIAKAEIFFGLVDDQPGNTLIPITKWVSHPEYNNRSQSGFQHADVEMLILASPAPSGYTPVAIQGTADILNKGDAVTIAGYGATEDNSAGRGTLYQGPMHITALHPWIPQLETDRAGYQGDVTGCHGDSGGPLYKQTGSSLQLVGLVKGGTSFRCGTGQSLFTDVRYLNDWITRAKDGQDTSARSVVPQGKGSDGKMYNYCLGNTTGSEFGDEPGNGGKCLFPVN